MSPGTPPSIFAGKLHEFLTCRAVARSLDGKAIDNASAKFFEELALKCVLRSMASGTLEIWQLQLLFQELPTLLTLKYPTVAEIKKACIQIIPQLMQQARMQNAWRRYHQYNYLLKMLKSIE